MNKKLIVMVFALLCFAGDALAQKPTDTSQKLAQQSCRAFVQEFYDWYLPVALQNNHEPAWNIALRKKHSVFSAQLQRLLARDSQAQSKSQELVGLDFDPFLNSQDPSERFTAEKVNKSGATCLVTVHGYSSGRQQETVVPEVRLVNGKWQFVNFHYAKNELALVSLLNESVREQKSDAHHK